MLFVLILYINGGTYGLKSTLNEEEEAVHGNFIHFLSFCQKSYEWEKVADEIIFFSYFASMSELGFELGAYV